MPAFYFFATFDYMRKAIALMFVGIAAVLTLNSVQVKAQNPMYDSTTTDSAALVVTPIFTGQENTKVDSLASIGKAILDPESQAVINGAIDQLKDTPKGGGVGDWLGYIVGAIGVIFGVYKSFSARWKAKRTG